MRLTPEQATRLLALPIAQRRWLAEQEGAGYWVSPHGVVIGPRGTPRLAGDGALALSQGWAWAPCDSVAWVRVARLQEVLTPREVVSALVDGRIVDAALDWLEVDAQAREEAGRE